MDQTPQSIEASIPYNQRLMVGVEEAAAMCCISVPYAWELVSKDWFPFAVKLGRRRLIRVDGLIGWMERLTEKQHDTYSIHGVESQPVAKPASDHKLIEIGTHRSRDRQ